MREVGGALQEFREVRHIAVQVLKGLMIKHTFDERYAAKVSGEDGLGVGRPGGWGQGGEGERGEAISNMQLQREM